MGKTPRQLSYYERFKKGKKVRYTNDILCFDIETTTAYNIENEWVAYSESVSEKVIRDCEKIAFPYIWMFGINDTVYYGRDFKDCGKFFDEIQKMNIKAVIYVHNINFEFQFLRNLSPVETIFAKKAHNALRVVFSRWKNLEFRCSYALTRLSLDNWAKHLTEIGMPIEKKVGYLEYNVLRTPFTKMTENELIYCEYDIRIMTAGLRGYLKKYGTVHDIPLTQTGEIRKKVLQISKKNGYVDDVARMQPRTYNEYQFLERVKRGGDSHASYLYAGDVLRNLRCLDYSSSYPFTMATTKTPIERYVRCAEFCKTDDKAYILYLRFKKIKTLVPLTYIPSSKCEVLVNPVKDNGRVMYADELNLWCTKEDFLIIEKTYIWEKIEILDIHSARTNYMNSGIVKLLFYEFYGKTTMKNVKGLEADYAAKKEFINSIYGMSISALCHDTVTFNNITGVFGLDFKNLNEYNNELEKAILRRKNGLPFSFGLNSVTQSRKMLWDGFEVLGYNNVVYYDTDSYKGYFTDEAIKTIDDRNRRITKECAKRNDIPMDIAFPKTQDGREEFLGHLTEEKGYCEFKTLGAKKYVYVKEGEKNVNIAIAGLPKKACTFFKSVNDLKNGLEVPRQNANKMCVQYLEKQPTVKFKDGYVMSFVKGCALVPIGFKVSLAEDYNELIDFEYLIESR